MSYRDCNAAPEAALACTPLALPRTRPLPAPIAAPAPGFPVAAPMTAPAAAPTTVPTVALATALWVAASSGATPIWSRAYCRHPASSAWKTSKGFPGAGHTITLGPWGTTAQALRTPIPSNNKPHLTYTSVLLLPQQGEDARPLPPQSLVGHAARCRACLLPLLGSAPMWRTQTRSVPTRVAQTAYAPRSTAPGNGCVWTNTPWLWPPD